MLCLARAILKRSEVIILDEATSSIDYGTDRSVTETIAEEFEGSTMLVIAHRLGSLAQVDRILVMHEGQIVKYDSPSVSLADISSRFYGLCRVVSKMTITRRANKLIISICPDRTARVCCF